MITSRIDGEIGFIGLARPEVRNALTPDMLDDLARAITDLSPGCGAIVLHGEGRVFCAGFDLAMCAADPSGDTMRRLLVGLSHAIDMLRSIDVPVVAAVHGAAIAGGCALLGGCDAAVASRTAKLGYPVVRIGVSPAVSAPFLRLLVGNGHGRERLLDPGLIDGIEAHRIGLVSDLVAEDSSVLDRATQVARGFAAGNRAAVGATKRWMKVVDAAIAGNWSERALAASMDLTGGEEERGLLRQTLSNQPAGDPKGPR